MSAITSGERHWVPVKADSLYSAVYAYNHEVVVGLHRHSGLPRPASGMEFEVRTEDGRTFRATWDAVCKWGNRQKRVS